MTAPSAARQSPARSQSRRVNDAPVLSRRRPERHLHRKRCAAVLIAPAAIVTDADNTNAASASVGISGNWDARGDLLTADTTGTSITASYNAGSGVAHPLRH